MPCGSPNIETSTHPELGLDIQPRGAATSFKTRELRARIENRGLTRGGLSAGGEPDLFSLVRKSGCPVTRYPVADFAAPCATFVNCDRHVWPA
jgi:hypothetical protein